MDKNELSQILRDNGVVGAGGAGFPTYAKLSENAQVILLNCAECEPLLQLHRQLLEQYTAEILMAFHQIAMTLDVKEAIIGIKKEYKEAVKKVMQQIDAYPEIKVHFLENAYPMGDEVVLIYETTGRVIRPGGLPIEAGVAVFNVETVYNVYQAVSKDLPVTDKLVTITGEVERPVTVRVPLGCTLEETVTLAGKITVENPVYYVGGPMMGNIREENSPVTKTTNAILLLPEEHLLVQRKQRKASIDLKRAASSCCQCQSCTDLCPRHELGHPIEPHKFMRSAANQDFQKISVFLDTFFCSSCGLCEMYSCPQGLSPRTLISEYKNGLRTEGVRPPADTVAAPVSQARTYRRVPEERLKARLGLSKYDREAPLRDVKIRTKERAASLIQETNELELTIKRVKLLLSQHIGAPAKAIVQAGDNVTQGQMIGAPAEGLSVALHAPMDGIIKEVTKSHIIIESIERREIR